MKSKNTIPTRIYPEDLDWIQKNAAQRKAQGIDKNQMKPCRTVKAMRNLIEENPDLLKKLLRLPLKK